MKVHVFEKVDSIEMEDCSGTCKNTILFNKYLFLMKMGYIKPYYYHYQKLFEDGTTYLSILPKDIQKLIEIPIVLFDGCFLIEAHRNYIAKYIGCFEFKNYHQLYNRSYQLDEEIYFDENHRLIDAGWYSAKDCGCGKDGHYYAFNNMFNPFKGINMHNLYIRQKSSCNIV